MKLSIDEFAAYSGSPTAHLDKVMFNGIHEIPSCQKYSYPDSIADISFYHPPVSNNWPVIYLDAEYALSRMDEEAFNIHPIRWDRVKSYVSRGLVEYPEINKNLALMDGRHRTIALIKTFGTKRLPFVCDPTYYDEVCQKAKEKNVLFD